MATRVSYELIYEDRYGWASLSLSLSHSINPSSFRLFLIYIYIYIYIYAHTHGFTELAVVTGTSSGLGRRTALALLRMAEYRVVWAVRGLDKVEAVGEMDEFYAADDEQAEDE